VSTTPVRPPVDPRNDPRKAPIYAGRAVAPAPGQPARQHAPRTPTPPTTVGRSDLRIAVKHALQEIITRQTATDPDILFFRQAAASGKPVRVVFRSGLELVGPVAGIGSFSFSVRPRAGCMPVLIFKAGVDRIEYQDLDTPEAEPAAPPVEQKCERPPD